MPRLVLTTSLTYQYGPYLFRRGVPIDVDDVSYHQLLAKGVFKDPTHSIDFVRPHRLAHLREGQEVPIIRGEGMGDVLMAVLGIREFVKMYPHLKVTYCMQDRYLPMFRDCTFLHRCISVAKLKGHYPWGIDLRGYTERENREKRDRVRVFAEYLVGPRVKIDYDFPLYPTREEIERGHMWTEKISHGKPVMVQTYRASLGNRSWPMEYIEHLAEIAWDNGWRTALIHGKKVPLSSRMVGVEMVNLTGQLGMQGLIEVCASADMVVGPDTGPIHLAEACKTKCVAYFTTVPPAARLNGYRYTRAIVADELPCHPCYHRPTCGKPDPKPCARAVTPIQIWEEVQKVLVKNPPVGYLADRQAMIGQEAEVA